MGLAALWYRRGGTSVELSIPCSHGGRALVVKGVEEVENIEINSKYQDDGRAERPRNFIRPIFLSSEGSARVNKDQHNSANPTPDSVIGELKQYGGSEFDYSTIATESG
ncbi:hypothetical protein B296_00001668 [Ensete ventricosum]|uniref:Uncharacterized protein n=1 Tax=Ensete ventricosum TaxID=4639 RepID=A0A427ARL1_ENSVE|nr:hypothetical protein B296_00001668 [Ensete ventricosum]